MKPALKPALKPGLLTVWRDRDTLQIGIDPRRAVALTGMGGVASLIRLLDGSRDRAQVIAAASERGIPPQTTERVLMLLAAGGALEDYPAGTYRALPAGLRSRLAPELAAASLAHGDSDGGAGALARRRAARVRVCGRGPIAAGLSVILTSAGAGEVISTSDWPAGPAAGWADLAVLIGRPDPHVAAQLVREQIPHLIAMGSESIGTVGPLVIPGWSACLRCMDLSRAERDPAWPLISAQLAGRQPDTPACDAALAAAVAAQAAGQALSFVDRPSRTGPVTNGTLELVLPAWQWRRRTWTPHRDCSCVRRLAHGGE